MTFFEVLLLLVGLAISVFVLDAAVRTFVLPRGTPVHPHVRRVPQRCARCSAVRPAGAELRAARPGDGAVRADRVARAADRVAVARSSSASPSRSTGSTTTAGATRSPRADRPCSRSASNGRRARPACCSASSRRAIGLGLLALVIAYLPTIYNAFSRREVAVTDLRCAPGTPPKPWEMLDARAPTPAT